MPPSQFRDDAFKTEYYKRRVASMKEERYSFEPHWKELAEMHLPRRGRFFVTDRNKGTKRYTAIINSKATQALKIATSGMLAGTMSPTRPWFNLETHNPDLMESAEVKTWLYRVELIMRQILNSSNFYGMASNLLTELLLFGTASMSHVDDFDDVARFYTHTAGEYMIAQNDKYEVDTFCREFEWTVQQIIRAFGIENVSDTVKMAYDKSRYDQWYPVTHFVEPNDEFSPNSKLSRNKKFKSVYFEPGNVNKNQFLSISGFEEFPVYAPRWDLVGGDIYGTDCPGMTALGDVKGLQIAEKEKAKAVQKMVSPTLKGPANLKNIPVNTLPAGAVFYDGDDTRQKLEPIYQINPQVSDLRLDMDAIERRIDKAFFVDMFLAITNIEGIQPRNQLDLMQRNEERLLQLGPVLERLHGEFLDPCIDRLFNQAVRADILPPPPEELSNQPLNVKYISTLAMAQRAVATQSIDKLANYVGLLTSFGSMDALKKFDAAQSIDEYAKAIGVPPSIIVSDDVVEEQKAAEAQQQQMSAEMEMAQGAANTAKMASDAKMEDKSVLTELARQ